MVALSLNAESDRNIPHVARACVDHCLANLVNPQPDIGPAPVGCRIHRMTGEMPPKRDGGPLIEKKLHRSTEAFSVFASYSRTSLT